MPEMPSTGEDQRYPTLVGGFDQLLVVARSTGLGDCGDPRAGQGIETVAEREEGVGSGDGSHCPVTGAGQGTLGSANP
jgi:hypothetical protein